MLNRRSLRIKVMQSLFALQQCKDANYELCLEKINEMLSPDLNSMEVQNKAQLATQKKQALQLFKEAFANEETSIDDKDVKIKKTVNDCLNFYSNQSRKDSTFFAKNLVSEVEKIYDRYIAVLSLAVEFLELAESDKKVSHKNFAHNRWINALRDSPEMKKELKKIGKHWSDKMDRVRVWFRDVVRQRRQRGDGRGASRLGRSRDPASTTTVPVPPRCWKSPSRWPRSIRATPCASRGGAPRNPDSSGPRSMSTISSPTLRTSWPTSPCI